MRTALARLLSASSFEPTTYGSAREFIDLIRNDIPECLIVDVHMPDYGARSAALSQSHQQKDSHSCHYRFRRCRRARAEHGVGCKAFLTEPLHGPTLIDAILNATGRALPAASPARAANLRKRRS